MHLTAEPVARLIEELVKLPGVGPRTAQRLAFFLLRASGDQARALAAAIVDVKEKVTYCSICFNITVTDPCNVCTGGRDESKICVVEEPLDVIALERTRAYRGLYHVLHGAIAPMEGIGPDRLRIEELVQRVAPKDGRIAVAEIILATNPDLEGEATAMYLHDRLSALGVKVTRLARGLPVGGDLEYADEITLTRAFQGRQQM